MMFSALAPLILGIVYRLRGGAFTDITGIRSTWLQRGLWALAAGPLIALQFEAPAWWLWPDLVAAVLASVALWGHGAHMIFDSALWMSTSKNKTELLTGWLPLVFGEPRLSWSDTKITAYNIIGMSTIGIVRQATMITPLITIAPASVLAAFTLSGIAHGPLYYAGWRLGGRSQLAEFLVGAWMALAIMYIL
jgi:hypothetical protein